MAGTRMMISVERNRLRSVKAEMVTILPVDLETSSGIAPGIPVKSLIFGFSIANQM
jgi:hypothetical protein